MKLKRIVLDEKLLSRLIKTITYQWLIRPTLHLAKRYTAKYVKYQRIMKYMKYRICRSRQTGKTKNDNFELMILNGSLT